MTCEDSDTHVMTYGKYKGLMIKDIPFIYLNWLIRFHRDDHRSNFNDSIEHVINYYNIIT